MVVSYKGVVNCDSYAVVARCMCCLSCVRPGFWRRNLSGRRWIENRFFFFSYSAPSRFFRDFQTTFLVTVLPVNARPMRRVMHHYVNCHVKGGLVNTPSPLIPNLCDGDCIHGMLLMCIAGTNSRDIAVIVASRVLRLILASVKNRSFREVLPFDDLVFDAFLG